MFQGNPVDAANRQREYYAQTASSYDSNHVSNDDEHMRALAFFSGIARQLDHSSILDVGAGTGRGVRFLKKVLPESRILGLEPVAELRAAGIERGDISKQELIEGDATALPFDDNQFDWVIETGVLHHIENPKLALDEMCRVARVGVLISDSNNMGQGSKASRFIKRTIKKLGLWNLFIFIQTGGRSYKWSEGDGIYFSFCSFDCVSTLKTKFSRIHYLNTENSGYNLYSTAPHVAIIAIR